MSDTPDYVSFAEYTLFHGKGSTRRYL